MAKKKKNLKKIKIFKSKQHKYNFLFKNIIFPFLLSFLVVFILIFFFLRIKSSIISKNQQKKPDLSLKQTISSDKIKEVLLIEKEVYLDPVDLINLIKNNNNDFVLVDLREKLSYNKAYIKRALNFDKKNLTKELVKYRNKTIIIYGETNYSSKPKTIALELLKSRYQVKILAVGFNEFRHFRNLWLPENLWDEIDVDAYIETSNIFSNQTNN